MPAFSLWCRPARFLRAFLALCCLFAALLTPPALAQTYTKLYDFGTNGALPQYTNLTSDGQGNFYGMTLNGNSGQLFKLKADGTYYDLHDFLGLNSDGASPYGSLTLSADGKTLYGMTYYGLVTHTSYGAVFSLPVTATTSTPLTILHYFDLSFTDGASPYGSLTLSRDGKTLYGMTAGGGTGGIMYGRYVGYGTIFSLPVTATTSTPVTLLHSFANTTTDGAYPYGNLTLGNDGNTLYGMTSAGGANNNGVIFSLPVTATTSTPVTLLHSFANTTADGGQPYGDLTLSSDGNTLYGMTSAGGAKSRGLVFSISTSGTGFTDLHDFFGSTSDGAKPYGNLTLSNATLYGMTYQGGTNNTGVIFSLPIGGGATTLLHSFTNTSTDGGSPRSSLTLSGDENTFYGMTSTGGQNGTGTVFRLPIPTTISTPFTLLHHFGASSQNHGGAFPQVALVSDGGSNFYGATLRGGNGNGGQLFVMTPAGTVTSIHDFGPYDIGLGALPTSLVATAISGLYVGSCQIGGNASPGQGILFSLSLPIGTTSATGLSKITSLGNPSVAGSHPLAAPIVLGTNLLVCGLVGGTNGTGGFGTWNPSTATLSAPSSLGATGSGDGVYPSGAGANYILTRKGGANGTGSLIKMSYISGNYSRVSATPDASFDPISGGTNTLGASPQGTPISDGTNLYGICVSGGVSGTGTLWKYDGTTLSALYSFPALDTSTPGKNASGASPAAGVIYVSGTANHLYGTTSVGGTYGYGTVFDYNLTTSTLTTLYSFGGVFGNSSALGDGQSPAASLIYTGGTLYGTTSYGGQYGQGTAFKISGITP